jgi:signal transduction histidine kinase
MQDVALRELALLRGLGWFIQVRWLFIAALVLAIVVGPVLFTAQFPVLETSLVAAAIAVYNTLLALHRRFVRRGKDPGPRASRLETYLQIGLDLVALTWLIHFTGGSETPFTYFYVFHAVVGTMLLSRREAGLVGIAAFGLFLAVVLLEYHGVIRHYQQNYALADGYRHVPHLAVICVAVFATLLSTIAITSSIVEGLRSGERKLVETRAELEAKSLDLEKAYATLTERQQQLIQTEKQASLGQLVAGIAHEINNPIQFIHGNMAILSEAVSDALPLLDERNAREPHLRIARLEYPFFREQVTVLLKDMVNGASRIESIVRDLKRFARKDDGQLDEDVDLNEVVRASMRLLHTQLKHLDVRADLAGDLPRLRGNAAQLEQVVVNVLQNAVEAQTGRAAAAIRVRTGAEAGGLQVRLSISDDGPGIAPEVKARIFDPFFTTKDRAGGTGLGLAIVYGIVHAHRGQVEVDTEVGRGTTFHFLLPVGKAAGAMGVT